MQALENRTAVEIFGAIDTMKLCSSLTLFEAAEGAPELEDALNRWFDGETDGHTLELIALDTTS